MDANPRFSAWRERVARTRLLVAGDVMLDRYWFGDVERISPEAPVPIVKIVRSEERPGGAANVARNAAAGADALVVVTEWKEFRSPDFATICRALKHPLVFDGRNLYEPSLVRAAGLEYFSIGRR